jgi:hypothetical protein
MPLTPTHPSRECTAFPHGNRSDQCKNPTTPLLSLRVT